MVEKLIPLLKDMVKEDVTQADLNQLEQFADKLFGKVGILRRIYKTLLIL